MPGPRSPAMPETGAVDAVLGISTDGALFIPSGSPAVGGIGTPTMPDNGGTQILVTGSFIAGTRYKVEIDGPDGLVLCYSGVPGQGEWSELNAAANAFTFITRPVPPGGPYDLIITADTPGPSTLLPAALLSVHRSYVTNLYGLRSAVAHPRYVGPRSIRDETGSN